MHNIYESSIYQKANPSSTEYWSFIRARFLFTISTKGKNNNYHLIHNFTHSELFKINI